jgi:NNP family nitrate/nitrite transporter-like MFS transporter
MNGMAGVRLGDQARALWLSTIAFTVCFAVWTIFSIIGIQIKKDLGLNDTQFGLLVGTPILTGSLIRLMLGIWTDQYGGRVVYTGVMLSAAVATWLLTFAYDYPTFLLAALGVGIAGGSFAVGIAYVSRWYPTEKQGTALGIFGAGNVGAAVTKFLAPFIMVAYGWQTVANIWAVAIAVMGSCSGSPPRTTRSSKPAAGPAASRNPWRSCWNPCGTSRSGASRSTTSSCSALSSRWRCGYPAT